MKMKVIVATGFLHKPAAIDRAIRSAMAGAGRGAKADFQTTVATWKKKPTFTIESPTPYRRIIGTESDIYRYVSRGTRPHFIRPRRGKRLRFQTGYSAKTTPRVLGSTGGVASGPTVFSRGVRHPGTEAREFEETVTAKWERQLPIILQRAIDSEA